MLIRPMTLCAALAVVASLAAINPAATRAQTVGSPPSRVILPASAIDVRYVDIDGDRRRDTVTITPGSGSVRITVVTATKLRATRTLAVSTDAPFYGTGRIDGARGAEILVDVNYYELRVLRWRKGRLVDEPVAQSSVYAGGRVVTRRAWAIRGDTTSWWNTYRLFTSRGVRYLDAASLYCGSCQATGVYDKVTIVRSRWKSKAWRKVKVIVHRKVSQKKAEAHYLNEFSGVKVTK
ncbi:MAG TPA: hypothetical protein PKD84_04240 [Propionicimonas sp.]|nr:hypothetical protein [Propionicimonas sp.]